MDTKEQILTKSLELFMRFGIKSVSMDDIAREVGISKKTLYQHVSDKRDLVNRTFERHIQNDETKCLNVMSTSVNSIQQLIDLAKHLVSTFSGMNPSTVFDIQKYYPTSWKLFDYHKHSFINKQIQDNLEAGIKSGLYRPEINVEIVTKFYISLIDATINPKVFPNTGMQHVKIFVQLFDYHLHAIMSNAGKVYFNSNKESIFN